MAHLGHQEGSLYLHKQYLLLPEDGAPVYLIPDILHGHQGQPIDLRQWIQLCIAKAYDLQALLRPQCIMAHSTRNAATTAAWATWASIEEVCRAATWSSPSPFI